MCTFFCLYVGFSKNDMKKIIGIFLLVFFWGFVIAQSNLTVFVTSTGKKYHYKNCRTISKSKNVTELSIEIAKEKGYKPCKVCKPKDI